MGTIVLNLEYVPEGQKRCLGRDEDDCAFIYTYQKNNITTEVKLFVQRDRSKCSFYKCHDIKSEL